jgi:hypothetical protein
VIRIAQFLQDAERPKVRSHAERGNETNNTCISILLVFSSLCPIGFCEQETTEKTEKT